MQGINSSEVSFAAYLKTIKSSFVRQQGWLLQIETTKHSVDTQIQPAEIQILLDQFNRIFAELEGLPLPRKCDYHIVLKEGAQPVAVQSYRYPHYQKLEIEKIM